MPNEQTAALDEKKLAKMKVNILEVERQNLNTREKTNDAMIDHIKQTIISIANQVY